MRKLISIQRLIEKAENDGKDPNCIMLDTDDLYEIDADELTEPEENPVDENPDETE